MNFFTLGEARQQGVFLLVQEEITSKNCSERLRTHLLDVDCILGYVAGVSKTYIFSHPEAIITEEQYKKFLDLIEKRKKGFPVAYLIEKKEFFGYDFFVSPDVLIPKPDTEILVEKALELVKKITLEKQIELENEKDFCSSEKNSLKIADICTGSGCVAISVAKKLQELNNVNFKMVATDICEKALNVAKRNCRQNDCNVEFLLGDLLEPLIIKNQSFDLIISNPPYVPKTVAKELLLDGRSEPILALDGDCGETCDGTGIIRRLVGQLDKVLRKGGYVIIEAGEYNIETVQEILKDNGFIQVEIFKDLSGMNRVIMGKKEK